MQVEYVQDTCNDLMVVNAARVSLAKHHVEFNEDLDPKLIRYLAKNNHFTPFTHSSLYFHISWTSVSDELHFLRNISTGGREFVSERGETRIRGSLYFWIHNAYWLPHNAKQYVLYRILTEYPYTAKAFNIVPESMSDNPFIFSYDAKELENSLLWKPLIVHTLRIKVPIFIARQIRTSHVGISYSDCESLYEEGEVFAYNEVSRRYVNTEPEFYLINNWRLREGNSIKQGSTGYADDTLQNTANCIQDTVHGVSLSEYDRLLKYKIAPEQARVILPQSMYTEFYMTATERRWKDFIALRTTEHVQEETREVAMLVADALPK